MVDRAGPRTRALSFALVGCLAGLATCSCARLIALLPESLADLVGCVFGLLLCAHFWLFDRIRSVWRSLGFVAASTLAYLAATSEGMHAKALWPVKLSLFGLHPYEINILLVGGFIGAGILFLALCFYFPVRQAAPALLLKFGIFVVAGSLLGVIGYALGPYLGAVIWHLLYFLHLGEPSQARQLQPSNDTASLYSLYVVWQSGIATLIAVLFPFRAGTLIVSSFATPHSSGGHELGHLPLPVWKRLVAVSMILLVVFLGGSSVHHWKMVKAQQEAQRKEILRSIVKIPPFENLGRVEPREPNQVLILQSISGHDWDGGSVTPSPPPDPRSGPPTLPPSVFYFVSYRGLPYTDPKQPGIPSFDVSVTEYPNSAWAKYSLRNYPVSNASITEGNAIQKISKFENSMYLNSASIYPDGTGTAYFYWPSGNFTVAIRFYGPTDDVVLQKYLALHPSSL
jgi:hypothetical protein